MPIRRGARCSRDFCWPSLWRPRTGGGGCLPGPADPNGWGCSLAAERNGRARGARALLVVHVASSAAGQANGGQAWKGPQQWPRVPNPALPAMDDQSANAQPSTGQRHAARLPAPREGEDPRCAVTRRDRRLTGQFGCPTLVAATQPSDRPEVQNEGQLKGP